MVNILSIVVQYYAKADWILNLEVRNSGTGQVKPETGYHPIGSGIYIQEPDMGMGLEKSYPLYPRYNRLLIFFY